ncbi:hypothetical protein [Streptomyces sp. x-19]|uniref:hypothetical protein n=1 Tax=Streptomyces sp. x-19 TaxID=2789280 RepID=UPI0039815ECA
MTKVDDLHIDATAYYGIEYYTYNEADEIAASSIDTIAGADLHEEITSRLFAYQSLQQDGDRIELTGDRGRLDGRRVVTYTKID